MAVDVYQAAASAIDERLHGRPKSNNSELWADWWRSKETNTPHSPPAIKLVGSRKSEFYCSVLGLLLSQGTEWKIQTVNQHKEWKYNLKIAYFGETSFDIKHIQN